MSPTPDAIVVGGGAIGSAIAWTLAREGVVVTLLERGELADEASGAAAGMLAPLLEAESDGPFLRHGLRALAGFPKLAETLRAQSGIDPEHHASGLIVAASDEREATVLRERAARLAGHGVRWLDGAAARDLEPALAEDTRGALFSPREAHVRSPLLVRAYAEAARRLGARIEEGVPVRGLLREGARITGVVTHAGERAAGCVVVAAGCGSVEVAAWADPSVRLPVTPVRGQIVSLDQPHPPLSRIVVGGGVYRVPKADGSIVVGATEEHVGFDRRVTAGGLATLLAAAPRAVPALASAGFRRAWAGLRPETPDHLPIVGPLPSVDGLLVATGHHRNGVLLSAVTAELVRGELLGDGATEPAFLPERWLRPARSADDGEEEARDAQRGGAGSQ